MSFLKDLVILAVLPLTISVFGLILPEMISSRDNYAVLLALSGMLVFPQIVVLLLLRKLCGSDTNTKGEKK